MYAIEDVCRMSDVVKRKFIKSAVKHSKDSAVSEQFFKNTSSGGALYGYLLFVSILGDHPFHGSTI